MELHERLVLARKSTKYTQKKLAELLKIAESTMNNYETGKRTPDIITIKDICALLGCSEPWLAFGVDNEFIQGDNPGITKKTTEEEFLTNAHKMADEILRSEDPATVREFKGTVLEFFERVRKGKG